LPYIFTSKNEIINIICWQNNQRRRGEDGKSLPAYLDRKAIPQQRIPNVRYTSKGNKVYVIVLHTQDTVFNLRIFVKQDKIDMVKCLSESRI
jgi:hypothetical protein